jgi:hypothetical protein
MELDRPIHDMCYKWFRMRLVLNVAIDAALSVENFNPYHV